MNLSDRLRTMRKSAGFSQKKLGEMCGFSPEVGSSRISSIERGKDNIYLSHLFAIAKALGVSPAELLLGATEGKEIDHIRHHTMSEVLKVLSANETSVIRMCCAGIDLFQYTPVLKAKIEERLMLSQEAGTINVSELMKKIEQLTVAQVYFLLK